MHNLEAYYSQMGPKLIKVEENLSFDYLISSV